MVKSHFSKFLHLENGVLAREVRHVHPFFSLATEPDPVISAQTYILHWIKSHLIIPLSILIAELGMVEKGVGHCARFHLPRHLSVTSWSATTKGTLMTQGLGAKWS